MLNDVKYAKHRLPKPQKHRPNIIKIPLKTKIYF